MSESRFSPSAGQFSEAQPAVPEEAVAPETVAGRTAPAHHTGENDASHTLQDGWRDAVLAVAAHYRLNASPEHIRVATQWSEGEPIENRVRDIARQAGLSMQMVQPSLDDLTAWRLPVVVALDGEQIAVVTALGEQGTLVLRMSGDQGGTVTHRIEDLQQHVKALAVLRPLESAPDARVDEYIRPVEPHWLRSLVLVDWRPYAHIMLASLITNLMALASVLFSMQVYDRVVPAQSMPTLYVLFGGVLLSFVFAWMLRNARMRITDLLGKRADLRISDRVFGHALRVRNSARPRSTGTFVSQIRELEPVRDMLTSTTIAAAADLPFFLLFCVVFWFLAGSLVLVPLVALVLLVIPSLLAQPRLRRLAQAGMREASLRNAMLVEAVQGIEDIKVLQAEGRFQNQWNHYNVVSADSGLELRELLGRLNNWMQTVQGAAYVIVIFCGVPAVIRGEVSTGVLVAASILVSRMLAPLASITAVLNRWQQAQIATQSLDQLMHLPVDNPRNETRVHRSIMKGEYLFSDAIFSHDGKTAALKISRLQIQPGERIAVLGRNGAGKSTLLQALSGLMEPREGAVMLDGVDLRHIDPADVRRDVGLLTQNARLFYGTLRENLTLGAPSANDDQILAALKASGAWGYVRRLPLGLDYLVQEGGLGLSGGQRQGILLARMLLRQPRVLLLDEPTTSLDDVAEREVIHSLRELSPECTLVVATHRTAVLDAVQRVIVIDAGTIVMDGPKADVLARLSGAADERPGAAADVRPSTGTGGGARVVVRGVPRHKDSHVQGEKA